MPHEGVIIRIPEMLAHRGGITLSSLNIIFHIVERLGLGLGWDWGLGMGMVPVPGDDSIISQATTTTTHTQFLTMLVHSDKTVQCL